LFWLVRVLWVAELVLHRLTELLIEVLVRTIRCKCVVVDLLIYLLEETADFVLKTVIFCLKPCVKLLGVVNFILELAEHRSFIYKGLLSS
jgi:hypothetical protein